LQASWQETIDQPPPPGPSGDTVVRSLQRGEVGVSFFPNFSHEIHNEKDFVLVDRSFQAGDLCKRMVEDVQSGVVTGVTVEGRFEHAISGEPVEGWAKTEDLVVPVVADIGDYVVYNDWVGQVRCFELKLFFSVADNPPLLR
jgi:ubiquitin-conjugating enzyme E2 O